MPLKWRGLQYFVGKVRFGSSGSYTQLTTDGRQTMVGAAKVYKTLWLPAPVWYGQEPDQFANTFNATLASAGSTNTVRPWDADFGKDSGSTVSIPVMSADCAEDDDARMSTGFIAPADAATTGSVEAKLYFTTKLAMATTGSMEVYRLRYSYLSSAGSPELGVTGSLLYGGSMVTTGNGKLEVWDLGDMASFNIAASPFVLLELALEGSDASCMGASPEDSIIGLQLKYVAENLGTQT